MTKPPHLKLIKSEDVNDDQEELSKDLSLDINFSLDFLLTAKSKEELDELFRVGNDYLRGEEFVKEVASYIGSLLAERLDEVPPLDGE